MVNLDPESNDNDDDDDDDDDDESSSASNSSSSSSSSSSSGLRNSSSILGASAWNQQKRQRSLQGRPLLFFLNNDNNDTNENDNNNNINDSKEKEEFHSLLQKRHYTVETPRKLTTTNNSRDNSNVNANNDTSNTLVNETAATTTTTTAAAASNTLASTKKFSELEWAVLMDCLTTSSSILFQHLPRDELELLADEFEIVKFQKHEIILPPGEPIQYLYILFSGDITTTSGNYYNNNNEKYTLLGELEMLTNSYATTATNSIKAKSNCTFFRLHKQYIQRMLHHRHHHSHTLSSIPSIQRRDDNGDSDKDKDNNKNDFLVSLHDRISLLQQAIPTEFMDYLIHHHHHHHDTVHTSTATTNNSNTSDGTDNNDNNNDSNDDSNNNNTSSGDNTILKRLALAMTIISFQKNDVLLKKKEKLNALIIIAKGKVLSTNNTMGGRSYDDQMIGLGESRIGFGWQSISDDDDNDNNIDNNNGENDPNNDKDNDNNNKNDATSASNSKPVHFQGTIVAVTDGYALVLSKESFLKILGIDHHHHHHHSTVSSSSSAILHQLAAKRLARIQLQEIPVFQDSALTEAQVSAILQLMHSFEYTQSNHVIIQRGDKLQQQQQQQQQQQSATTMSQAAMYFVRQGNLAFITGTGQNQTIRVVDAGGYFGEQNMLLDQNKDGQQQQKQYSGTNRRSTMTIIANYTGNNNNTDTTTTTTTTNSKTTVTTKIDVLYLEELRKVVDTTVLGLGTSPTITSIDQRIQLQNLKRHALLGSGTFGQVWLATTTTTTETAPTTTTTTTTSNEGKEKETQEQNNDDNDNKNTKDNDNNDDNNNGNDNVMVVALKVQSKYRLLQAQDSRQQAERIIAEKNILSSLHSPFIIRLYNAFQDESLLYMVTSILLGGELESIIQNTTTSNNNSQQQEQGISEQDAKFYAAGILEGLAYMHHRHILHRDVKTENVLINEMGYPVLIDFGFAKYVPDKTYTFCGSPMFTAPEIIQYKGHDRGCDYWSWGVLVYKMVTGRYPFYDNNNNKGMDELSLYKRICKGTFELDGQMSMEFRYLMTAVLYPDPTKRLGSSRPKGWNDIFDSPWFVGKTTSSGDGNGINLRKLRRQELKAPWVPNLKDSMDVSKFHHHHGHHKRGYSSSLQIDDDDDFMNQQFPKLSEEQQGIFESFGPIVSDSTRNSDSDSDCGED